MARFNVIRPIDPYRLGKCRDCYAVTGQQHTDSCVLAPASAALAEYLGDRVEAEPEDTAYGRMAFAAFCAAATLSDSRDYDEVEAAHRRVATALSVKADDEGGGYFMDLGAVGDDEDDRINLTALEYEASRTSLPAFTWLLYSNGGAQRVSTLNITAPAETVAAWVREVLPAFRVEAAAEAVAAEARRAAYLAARD